MIACREQSALAAEPIAGTAVSDVDCWLLAELRARWEAEIDASPLGEPALAAMKTLAERVPRLRPQLIRQPIEQGAASTVIALRGSQARRYQLATLAELADLVGELEGFFSGEVPGSPLVRPLALVCTHGRRDRCCAVRGVALHRALEEVGRAAGEPFELWQSSHQGGHRFAATMLLLPEGLHYGRLEADEAAALWQAHAGGQLYRLDRFRGRTRYSRAAQAAESALCERLGEHALGALALVDEHTEAGHTRVRFRHGSDMHELVMHGQPLATPIHTSCNAPSPTRPVVLRLSDADGS